MHYGKKMNGDVIWNHMCSLKWDHAQHSATTLSDRNDHCTMTMLIWLPGKFTIIFVGLNFEGFVKNKKIPSRWWPNLWPVQIGTLTLDCIMPKKINECKNMIWLLGLDLATYLATFSGSQIHSPEVICEGSPYSWRVSLTNLIECITGHEQKVPRCYLRTLH